MPRFSNRNKTSGKKVKKTHIGISAVTEEFKRDLEILAEHNKRTLSDFCRIELEKVLEQKENQEILNKYKREEDTET